MVKQMYPRVEVNLQYLKENVAAVVEKCKPFGTSISVGASLFLRFTLIHTSSSLIIFLQ